MRKFTSNFSSYLILVFAILSFCRCSSYDEEDATIIAYLKINDLIEERISGTSKSEIEKWYSNAQNATYSQALFGYSAGDFDMALLAEFTNKYGGKDLNFQQLESDISSELWYYFNSTYSEEEIPAKAQNSEEGRFYTISELKEKYPDYKEVEITGFSPVVLIDNIMKENLFEESIYAKGGISLRTLYTVYLACKPKETNNENVKGDYVSVEGRKLFVPSGFSEIVRKNDSETVTDMEDQPVVHKWTEISYGMTEGNQSAYITYKLYDDNYLGTDIGYIMPQHYFCSNNKLTSFEYNYAKDFPYVGGGLLRDHEEEFFKTIFDNSMSASGSDDGCFACEAP